MQITEIDENKQITSELHDLRKEYNTFAYIISHDLNANFRGIKTVADWFQQDYADVLDENGQELLGLLRDRVNRTQQMLETVLDFSRIGRVQNNYEQFVNVLRLIYEYWKTSQISDI